MKLKDILSKVAEGKEISDEEKEFIKAYDEEKTLSSACAAARRKAESERDKAIAEKDAMKAEKDNLQKEVDELKDSSQSTTDAKDKQVAELTKRIDKLEADKATAEAKVAKVERDNFISKAFSDANVKPAKGISETTFKKMLEISFDGIDISKEDDVKAAIEKFKTENAGIIADPMINNGGGAGDPSTGGKLSTNPFAEKTFNLTEQIKLYNENPAEAQRLMTEAKAGNNQ